MSDEALIQASRASRSQAPPTPAGDNVIILTRALVTRDAHAEEGMSARRRAKGGQPPVPSGCAGRHADHPRG
jgi:hypothetical protein